MLISAHPDDIEGCVGGLVSMLTQQDIDVYYVILTNGDKGMRYFPLFLFSCSMCVDIWVSLMIHLPDVR